MTGAIVQGGVVAPYVPAVKSRYSRFAALNDISVCNVSWNEFECGKRQTKTAELYCFLRYGESSPGHIQDCVQADSSVSAISGSQFR
jgi:hypothetical protein